MNPLELTFGLALAVVLIGLAIFFTWRQWQTAVRLRRENNLPDDERRFLFGQVRRRTLGCVFMVLFAGVLVGGFFLPVPTSETPDLLLSEAEKKNLWFLAGYWIFAFLDLAAIIVLAIIDFLATARFGLSLRRKLLLDQRDQLLLDAARLRQARRER